tara:strand:- start:1411 stop:1872 length:462 start_codon:yes stop_codon:yes gene_type:complete
MNLVNTLEQVFATNFQVYYRTHVAHVNIVGRNFVSDHKQLQKIYEELQSNIDSLAEILRTLRTMMPASLSTVLDLSIVSDSEVEGTAEELLQLVYDDLETMIDLYQELVIAADDEDHTEISNFAQDQMTTLRRHCWQLRSVLEERTELEEEYE